MQISTQVRWKSFGAAVGLFAITLLLSGATWTISSPPNGSYRSKTSSVGGGGMVSGGTVAVFRFGDFDGGIWNGENDVTVMPVMTAWGGDISAPTPDGWVVEANKEAWIEWDDGDGAERNSTNQHTVTN